MIKRNYFKLLKSISTFVICTILLVISIVSFTVSLFEKNSFIHQLNSTSPDINIDALNNLIEHYNGFKLIFNFWFVSDLYFIFVAVTLLFLGVFLSYQIQKHKEEAYGNLLVSRIGYKKYLDDTLVSQSLYIFSIVTITNLISLTIAFIFGGMGCDTDLSSFDINIIQALIIIFVQNLFLSIVMVLINSCTLLASCFIKNKYILQAFPLFMFLILPQLIVSTLGNVSSFIGNITLPFVLWNELMAIDNIINDYKLNGMFSNTEIIYYLIPILTYFILFIVLYCINLKKNERDYI